MFAKTQSGRRKQSKPMALDARLELAAERNRAPVDPLDRFVTAVYSDLQKERQECYKETRKRGRPRKTRDGYPPEVFFKGTIFENMFGGKKKERKEEDAKFEQYYQQIFGTNVVLENGLPSDDKENQRNTPIPASSKDADTAGAQLVVDGFDEELEHVANADATSDIVEVPPEYESRNRKERSIDNVKTWLQTLRDEDIAERPSGSSSPAISDESDGELLGTSKSGNSDQEELATSDDCVIIDEAPVPAPTSIRAHHPVIVAASQSEETLILRPQDHRMEAELPAHSSSPGTSDQEGSSGKENVPVQHNNNGGVMAKKVSVKPYGYKHEDDEEIIYLSSDSEAEVEVVATTKALEEVVITLDDSD